MLEDIRADALAVIAISDATIRRDLALVFRKDKALSRAALAFIDIAVKIKDIDALASGNASQRADPVLLCHPERNRIVRAARRLCGWMYPLARYSTTNASRRSRHAYGSSRCPTLSAFFRKIRSFT